MHVHSSHGYPICEHSIILMYQYPATGHARGPSVNRQPHGRESLSHVTEVTVVYKLTRLRANKTVKMV